MTKQEAKEAAKQVGEEMSGSIQELLDAARESKNRENLESYWAGSIGASIDQATPVVINA